MAAITLGYVIVESVDPSRWRKFAVDTLGIMEGAPGPEGVLRLRIDERPFRIEVRHGEQNRFVSCGWEFGSPSALEACLDGLRESGHAVRPGTPAEADARCVREVAFCSDPCGNQLELYWGRANDHLPFASPRGLSGFVAGELGMGHAVLPAPALEASRSFYERHLGLSLTDEMWLQMSPNPQDPKLGIYFMHAQSRRHHSLGLMGAPAPSGCVHIMLEARTLDDVGYALDRCNASGAHISSSLGKHSNDFMVSFYVQTPGGFDLEFGCAGFQPDWSTWVPTYSLVPDLWGHRWSPPPAPVPAGSK